MIWCCGNFNPRGFCKSFLLGTYIPASKKLRCLEFQEYTWIGHLGERQNDKNKKAQVCGHKRIMAENWRTRANQRTSDEEVNDIEIKIFDFVSLVHVVKLPNILVH